jgi:hypothetical protein
MITVSLLHDRSHKTGLYENNFNICEGRLTEVYYQIFLLYKLKKQEL